MKVWQIAAGEPGRDYRKLFFDHDVMLLGQGTREMHVRWIMQSEIPTQQIDKSIISLMPRSQVIGY